MNHYVSIRSKKAKVCQWSVGCGDRCKACIRAWKILSHHCTTTPLRRMRACSVKWNEKRESAMTFTRKWNPQLITQLFPGLPPIAITVEAVEVTHDRLLLFPYTHRYIRDIWYFFSQVLSSLSACQCRDWPRPLRPGTVGVNCQSKWHSEQGSCKSAAK